MASGTTVALVGGPCDGETRNITDKTLKAGKLTCRGTEYDRTNVIHVGDLIVFATKDAIIAAQGGVSPGAGSAPQALSGWSDLRRSVNQTIPSAVRQMRAAQDAALRELRHGRRVRH